MSNSDGKVEVTSGPTERASKPVATQVKPSQVAKLHEITKSILDEVPVAYDEPEGSTVWTKVVATWGKTVVKPKKL
jgi:hypothetical protein